MPPLPSPSVAALPSAAALPYLTKLAANPHASVGKWILGTGGLVAGMVHVGGVTRLTKSGLSMTDWKPLGGLPPLTAAEWEAEFDRYKQYPEWQQRRSMTLDDFKYIFYWEWGHRMLGRTVGLAFAAPWAYFAVRGRIPAGYHGRMVTLFAMGGTQGLVGWWMVKSGLGDDRRDDRHEIRVSPYRLAAHLGMAVATYGTLVYTGLGILSVPHDAAAGAAAAAVTVGGGGGCCGVVRMGGGGAGTAKFCAGSGGNAAAATAAALLVSPAAALSMSSVTFNVAADGLNLISTPSLSDRSCSDFPTTPATRL